MDQYHAFISYSHDDLAFAERISKRIRRYKAPKSTGLHKNSLKIFRDVERLTANSHLSDALTERLKASDKLILLCSPSAATSEYVEEEVATFLKLKSYDDLVFIVCRGSFEEGVPPRLLKKDEPLFIDLSNAKKKQFRDETLRLIAALYGVDYAKLYREDEKLRRRKRSTLTLTLVTLLFLIVSGFLIITTQPEAWERIAQPVLDQDLMPIHEFAVNEEDPSIILYEGQDAQWGMNPRPDGYSLFPNRTFSKGSPNFIKNLNDYSTAPLVKIRFQVVDRQGSGEVDIYGIWNNTKKELYFYRSLKFDGVTRDSIQKQIRIPPSLESVTVDPYNLSPWPMDTLQKEGLYGRWESVEGVLINLVSGEEVETTFDQQDFDEGFDEMVEIWDQEYRIFSNVDAETLVVLGDTLAHVDNEYEIWDTIVKSSEWNTYHKPQRKALGTVYESGPEAVLKVADSVPDTIDRDSLVAKMTRFSKNAEFTAFTLITSNSAANGAFVIEAEGFIDSPESFDGIPLQWLFRANSFSAVHYIELPDVEKGTSIIDIISIAPSEAFIVTDTQGFYLTEDGGQSWREANFGETNLGNGRLLKTIVTGNPPQVYCLVDRNTSFSDGENALFRFIRRNWVQRWKAGLVRILQ